MIDKTEVLERLDVDDCDDPFQVVLHEQRYDFTIESIPSDHTVLEIGTGLGVFSARLSKHAEYYRGVEYDERTCAAAKKRVADPEWVSQGDAQALEFPDESFDVVVCLEVLEHLPNYRAALDEIKRVLRPGGTFIASIPHVEQGAPSKINPHHLYEPGESEFREEIAGRFTNAEYLYQRYPETGFETMLRKLRLRRFFGKAAQYAGLIAGNPAELAKICYDDKKSGLILGLTVVAKKERQAVSGDES